MRGFKGIERVWPAGELLLGVRFKGGDEALVDLEAWVGDSPSLQKLRDPTLFAKAHVHEWGWSIEWIPDELDISGEQLWRMAGEQAGELMPLADFRDWRERHGLSIAAAGRALGISRRMASYYDSGRWPIPKTVMLACEGIDARHEAA